MLAEIDITEQLKDPGFVQWLIYAYLGLTLWEKISGLVQRRKAADVRVVSGDIDVAPRKQFADKADTDKAIKEFKTALKELQESLTAQHTAAIRAGEERVRNLSVVLDSETSEIKNCVHDLSAEVKGLTAALHEKINHVAIESARHGEALSHLQAQNFIIQNKCGPTGKR